jgi:hypothetical protein
MTRKKNNKVEAPVIPVEDVKVKLVSTVVDAEIIEVTEEILDENPELSIKGFNVGDEVAGDLIEDIIANSDLIKENPSVDAEAVTEFSETQLEEIVEEPKPLSDFHTGLKQLLIRRNATGDNLGIPFEYVLGYRSDTNTFTTIVLEGMDVDYMNARINYCMVDPSEIIDLEMKRDGVSYFYPSLPINYDLVDIDGCKVAVFNSNGKHSFTQLFDISTGTLKACL